MTRNIEINYLNSSGYDLLYPKAIDSNTEVDAIIKEILSLSESDMLDDVLLNMVLPDNKYAVALTVKTPGGRPFNGASVSGITSYVGEALTTDENGYVLGFCDTSTPTVTVTNPFLDMNGNVVQQLNLSGKVINTVEMVGTRKANSQTTFSSGTRVIRFSFDVDEFDCSAIGGGQNGEQGDANTTIIRNATGGRGGNAGEVINEANITNTTQEISVTVGGIGADSIIGEYVAHGGGGASGGTGAYATYDSRNGTTTRTEPGVGENSIDFLYPPTQVGGAGGGGGVGVGNDRIVLGLSGGAGGQDGGGPGAGYSSASAIYQGDDGECPGSGGGGGGSEAYSYRHLYDGGSGQPGLVGFMWRYKSDLT